jgi:transcriptional regulator with XRE-family HTH domain
MGWTQAELGEKLSVKAAAISKYEKGDVSLTDETLRQLSSIFNTSVDFIICVSDDSTPIRNVNQDLIDDQDVESQWHAFVDEYSKGTSMFYQYENVSDEQKLLIMEEYKEKLEKKKKKVLKFMDFSDEVIDEALNFAAYNEEQRKKKGDI